MAEGVDYVQIVGLDPDTTIVWLGCLVTLAIQYLANVVIDKLRVAYISDELKQLFDDINLTGAQGVWITDSCNPNPTSSTPTMQIYTARYSQPGHFGLLLVSQGYERVKTCCSTCSCTYFYTYT